MSVASLEPDSSCGACTRDSASLGLTVERWGENEREIVEHPGAVAMVAVDAEGYVTLVRQLREADAEASARDPCRDRRAGRAASRDRETGATGGVRPDRRRVARAGGVLDDAGLLSRTDARVRRRGRRARGSVSGRRRGARARPLAGRRDRAAAARDRGREDARRLVALPQHASGSVWPELASARTPPPRVGADPADPRERRYPRKRAEAVLSRRDRKQVPRGFVARRRGDSVSGPCVSAFRRRSRPTSTAWRSPRRARAS